MTTEKDEEPATVKSAAGDAVKHERKVSYADKLKENLKLKNTKTSPPEKPKPALKPIDTNASPPEKPEEHLKPVETEAPTPKTPEKTPVKPLRSLNPQAETFTPSPTDSESFAPPVQEKAQKAKEQEEEDASPATPPGVTWEDDHEFLPPELLESPQHLPPRLLQSSKPEQNQKK